MTTKSINLDDFILVEKKQSIHQQDSVAKLPTVSQGTNRKLRGLVNHVTSVDSGEVKACKDSGILRAGALGSCVAVAAYDRVSRVGAMAHVMLPGTSRRPDDPFKTRYAADALEVMMRMMEDLGARPDGVRVCLVGGGNVLGDGHDSLGLGIVQSVSDILRRMGVVTVAIEVGGTQRRSCTIDVASGRVTCTVSDSGQRLLWDENGEGKE